MSTATILRLRSVLRSRCHSFSPQSFLSTFRPRSHFKASTSSKYGILVYRNHSQWPRATRTMAITMVISTPLCFITGYVDTILSHPNEEDPDVKDVIKWTIVSALLTGFTLYMGRETSRKSLSGLYYNKQEKKIYLEAFSGWFAKPRTFGPYTPSIAYRTLETKKEGSSYNTYNMLHFEPNPMSARLLSVEEIKEQVRDERCVEAKDMGNKVFEIRDEMILEYAIWRRLFQLKETAMKEDLDSKLKRKVFD